MQLSTPEVTGILFEAPQNISAPYGFNVSIFCRGNGKIVWDFNDVQVRGPQRILDFLAIGIFTKFDELNESTTVILASTSTENYRIACRVERGSILNGVEFQRSPIAYFGIFSEFFLVKFVRRVYENSGYNYIYSCLKVNAGTLFI